MNTDIYSDPPRNQLQEAAGEITRRIADVLRGIAKRATSNAKNKLLAREITWQQWKQRPMLQKFSDATFAHLLSLL